MRKPPRQTSLFDLVTTRQPRRMARESVGLYQTIIALRRIGISVQQAGRLHRVGQALMTTSEMTAYARLIGVKP